MNAVMVEAIQYMLDAVSNAGIAELQHRWF
jgi:hypothetical protein